MLKVGLTGGIGSGKTAVSDLFDKLGTPVIDTDIISHELVSHDKSVFKAIIDTFGGDVLDTDNTIDRKKLAGIIFAKEENKRLLEKILHPKIRDAVNEQIQHLNHRTPAPDYLIVVIPLLLETGFSEIIDRILIVMADEDHRIKRVMQRDNRKLDEVQSIIQHQVDDRKRVEYADDIIENNNDINQLQEQVRRLHQKYSKLQR
ncbi:MAG TPA: dephospho-CoA kinase [Gammaproteobacteria bacterium]|nr:dephospho-CoA kinase [Gammaproteobacteria bacterium]